MRARDLVLTAVVAMSVLLCGCGGAGGPQGDGMGTLSVKVVFPPLVAPASDKVIPPGTDSVLLTVSDPATGERLVPDTVVRRPETGTEATAVIGKIRPGPACIHASAHTGADGSGPALAQATVEVEIISSQTVRVGMVLFGVTAAVEITPPAIDLLTTKTMELVATAYDAIGNVVVGAEFTWESSDTTVATVDAKGLADVTGVSPGRVVVSATDTREGVRGDCDVTITLREPVRVEVTPPRNLVKIGASVPYSATAFDRDGDPIVEETFDWDTADHAIATADSAGVVTGVAGGVTDVVAKTTNLVTGSAPVDVYLYLVTLAWEGAAQLDLHAFGPGYAHASRFSPDIAAGSLVDLNEVTPAGIGGARQYFAGRYPLSGAYYFAVNYYAGSGPVTANVTVEGIGPEPFVNSYELRVPNANRGYPVRGNTTSWFRPADVYIGTHDISVAQADTTVSLYDTAP